MKPERGERRRPRAPIQDLPKAHVHVQKDRLVIRLDRVWHRVLRRVYDRVGDRVWHRVDARVYVRVYDRVPVRVHDRVLDRVYGRLGGVS